MLESNTMLSLHTISIARTMLINIQSIFTHGDAFLLELCSRPCFETHVVFGLASWRTGRKKGHYHNLSVIGNNSVVAVEN